MLKVNKSTGGFKSKLIVLEIPFANSTANPTHNGLKEFCFNKRQNTGELQPKQVH